jgi:hypothetical protein
MQNMPCEVRAYRRFSIFLLQFLQRKHVAQNAWSPVRIARSSILFPQALQLYVQLLQIRDPSPRRRRFASESSRIPQVLHRKQLRCHRFPPTGYERDLSTKRFTWLTKFKRFSFLQLGNVRHVIVVQCTQKRTHNFTAAPAFFVIISLIAVPKSKFCFQ